MRCANITDSEYTRLSNSSESWMCTTCIIREQRQQSTCTCGHCHRPVGSNHRGVCCDQCNQWFHAICVSITENEYARLSNSIENWICTTCLRQTNALQPRSEPEITPCHARIPEQTTNHGNMTQQQYLYSGGWQTQPLHTQSWVQKCMNQFQAKQNQWQNIKCNICNECWPTKTNLNTVPYICNRCQKDKHNPKLFYSAENNMDPGNVPPCLQDMTQIEELLIARACPILSITNMVDS